MKQIKQHRHALLWGGLVIITVLFLVAMAFNVHPALRGPDDWRWTYAIPGVPGRYILPALLVFAYTAVAFFWARSLALAARPSRKKQIGLLIFCALSVPMLQLALLSAESPDVIEQLFFRAVSAGSSGFFSVGSIIDDSSLFLANYPELMPTFPVHPQRYPPGLPLLFYWVRQPLSMAGFGESAGAFLRPYQCTDLTLMRIPNEVLGTAVLQMFLPFISGLVIFPMFGLARRALGWQTAVWSVVLYPLIPSFALWAGRWDQFFPLLTVTAWYLLVVGLVENRRAFLFAAGFVLALASFFSFGLVVMLAPMGIWALLWLFAQRTEQSWSNVVINGGVFLTGLMVLWLFVQVRYSSGLLDIWQVSMSYHLGLARSYWTWLGYHLYDFGMFLGVPLALLCLFAFFYALLNLKNEIIAFPIAYGLGVLILNFSGTARGEVARVWIFLTPFAVICAVWAVTRLSRKSWPFALVLILLGGQLLTFTAVLRVVNTGLESVPAREVVWQRPLISQPVEAQFNEAINLLGYDLIQNEAGVDLTLYWQTEVPLATTYTVFNHLLDENGELIAQLDGMPQNGSLPTTCWLPGEYIQDRYIIPLDQEMRVAELTILTGLYDPYSGDRLLLTDDEAPFMDAVVIQNAQP